MSAVLIDTKDGADVSGRADLERKEVPTFDPDIELTGFNAKFFLLVKDVFDPLEQEISFKIKQHLALIAKLSPKFETELSFEEIHAMVGEVIDEKSLQEIAKLFQDKEQNKKT